jgi:hypothetical protein
MRPNPTRPRGELDRCYGELRSKHLQARAEQLAGQDIKETAEADEIEDSDVDPTD